MPADHPLRDIYLDTVITIEVPTHGTIEVRAAEVSGGPWPLEDIVHVVTAWNPHGEVRGDAANRAAGARLRAALGARDDLTVMDALGASPDGAHREESLALAGCSRTDALAIAAGFGQLAIFELDDTELRVIWCAEGDVDARPRVTRYR